MTLAEQVLFAARASKAMLTTAESCTGGLIAGAITEVPGSSDIFERGFVTYSNDAKQAMLGVTKTSLDTYGAVSEAVAREMANGALNNSDATHAVAVTGIAGPGSSEHKPEGRVCFGVAVQSRGVVTETVEFGAIGRSQVRKATVDRALTLLLVALR